MNRNDNSGPNAIFCNVLLQDDSKLYFAISLIFNNAQQSNFQQYEQSAQGLNSALHTACTMGQLQWIHALNPRIKLTKAIITQIFQHQTMLQNPFFQWNQYNIATSTIDRVQTVPINIPNFKLNKSNFTFIQQSKGISTSNSLPVDGFSYLHSGERLWITVRNNANIDSTELNQWNLDLLTKIFESKWFVQSAHKLIIIPPGTRYLIFNLSENNQVLNGHFNSPVGILYSILT